MPEQPAKKDLDFGSAEEKNLAERLATPQELAEFGQKGPDPETEARILALFEQQLVEAEAEVGPAEGVPEEAPSKVTAAPLEISLTQTESIESPAVLAEPQASEETVATEASVNPPAPAEEVAAHTVVPTEVVPQSYATHSHLLEFAEVLDQHRVWVESGGKEGIQGDLSGANLSEADLTGAVLQGAQMQKVRLRGADLSMANLRKANLVEADLRDTNLLGTEFSGANMMGANLYGAQGLWAGRLGGTNLFDAALPEAVGNLNAGKTIAEFTQSARWFYALLMALCAGAVGLIAMTTDVRLLLDGSALRTSRIPNMLPLQGFYLGAPLLLTVFYLRLQFLLLRLWGSVGAMPAVFPRRADTGERWPVVPDGTNPAVPCVVTRSAIATRNGGELRRDGLGVLGRACRAVFLLVEVPGAAGLPWNAAACVSVLRGLRGWLCDAEDRGASAAAGRLDRREYAALCA